MEKQNNRATKRQKELLDFIDGFIKGNGYGPSYREIMRALDYRSVSTVATHVNGLIKKGFLSKTDDSARSLIVLQNEENTVASAHKKWLAAQLAEKRFEKQDSSEDVAAIDRVAKLFSINL